MKSKNFSKVKQYYNKSLWNLAKVTAAVGKWITETEFEEITEKKYE